MISYKCSQCEAALESPDSLAGKEDLCIHCGGKVVVPGKIPPGGSGRKIDSNILGLCIYISVFFGILSLVGIYAAVFDDDGTGPRIIFGAQVFFLLVIAVCQVIQVIRGMGK